MSVIRLYPNPAKEMIQLSLPANYDNFEGTIFDLSGRSIKTITSPTNIDVNELSSGMYILKATLDNVPFEQKFIKD
jgi:aminopeptidase YwaD